MRITWVTRSFLDYRIILYKKLADMPDVEFTLLSSTEHTPDSVREKAREALGGKVQFLVGEKCFGKPYSPEQRSNSARRVFWQPGLSEKIMATRPDVVITDAFNHWTLPVLNLRRKHSFKHIVCYERTAYTERNASWLKRKFIKFVGRWIDAVHYNGILCHDFLRQLGYPEDKLKPGNMTVDVEKLSAQCASVSKEECQALKLKYGISSIETVFLFIGQLIPRKGLRETILGWKTWIQKNPNVQATLLLVGDGPQESELKTLCKQENLDNVIFAGRSSYEDIPKFLAMSDVFIIPTLEDNWSLVVPEAMSCGKPIICSCYNGCWPELVHENENGWIINPLDEQNIVSVLDKAYNSRDYYKQMGEKSCKLVKLFSPLEIASSIFMTCQENVTRAKIGFVAGLTEKLRSLLDYFVKKKVHWGCVSHYRKMLSINKINNKLSPGEDLYLAKWKKLSPLVACEDYRLFSAYTNVDSNTVPESVSHNIVEAILNPIQYRAFYSDKNAFDVMMPAGIMPVTYLRRMQGVFRKADYTPISEENINLDNLLGNASRIVIKPTVDSSSGSKVTIFEKQIDKYYAMNGPQKGMLLTLVTAKRYFGNDFIVQEYLEQADFFRKLCPTSINTIRLFVYRSFKNEEVVVPAVIMRLGHTGSLVDNSHAGGVSIGIDKNGKLGKYATDQYGQRYTMVNGIDFQNSEFQIPNFDRIIEFSKMVGTHLWHTRMANIDVMVDSHGTPRLIEYNLNSMSTWLYQFDVGNAYGDYADEIIEYCSRHLDEAKHVRIEY